MIKEVKLCKGKDLKEEKLKWRKESKNVKKYLKKKENKITKKRS